MNKNICNAWLQSYCFAASAYIELIFNPENRFLSVAMVQSLRVKRLCCRAKDISFHLTIVKKW